MFSVSMSTCCLAQPSFSRMGVIEYLHHTVSLFVRKPNRCGFLNDFLGHFGRGVDQKLVHTPSGKLRRTRNAFVRLRVDTGAHASGSGLIVSHDETMAWDYAKSAAQKLSVKQAWQQTRQLYKCHPSSFCRRRMAFSYLSGAGSFGT